MEHIQQKLILQKPTTRIYYEKLVVETPLFASINFDVLRNKSKNLKESYQRAIKWRQNTGQGVENEESIRDYILRICPHFDLLDEIYSERPNVNPPYIIDTSIEISNSSQNITPDFQPDSFISDDSIIEITDENSPNGSFLTQMQQSEPIQSYDEENREKIHNNRQTFRPLNKKSTNTDMASTPKKPRFVQNSMQQLADLQKSRAEMHEKKYLIELKKLEANDKWEQKKLEIEIERNNIEKEKILLDERMKIAELKNQERIRKMEIEKEERLAMYELQLKYQKENLK